MEIRALLSELEAEFTLKLQHRLLPKACSKCGTVSTTFGIFVTVKHKTSDNKSLSRL